METREKSLKRLLEGSKRLVSLLEEFVMTKNKIPNIVIATQIILVMKMSNTCFPREIKIAIKNDDEFKKIYEEEVRKN